MIFNLLYFLCISLSVSYMYSFSEIFKPIRNFISKIPYVRRPFLCPECASFWFGLMCSFLYNPIYLDFDFFIIKNLLCGLITHIFASFLYKKLTVKKSDINFIN